MQKLILSRNTALGDAGMRLLADALPATVALKHLDISNTGCGDAGLIAIATALGRTQAVDAAVGANLTELILYGNDQAKGPGWRALAEALPQLVNLRRLDCSRGAGMGCELA